MFSFLFFVQNYLSYRYCGLFFIFFDQNNFLVYFILCIIVSCILVIIPYVLNGRSFKEVEKITEYECGFEPFDNATRQPFTIHFYIVGILFLIFDVEIVLLFPWSIILLDIDFYGLFSMLFFLAILTLGFVYEWQIGAINWGPQE